MAGVSVHDSAKIARFGPRVILSAEMKGLKSSDGTLHSAGWTSNRK
jgi:hypothetical protein